MAERVPGEELDAAGPAGRGGFDPAASAGLFVGVSTFEDDRIAEVPYAVDDAVDLAHLFALEFGFLSPERTVLLLAGEPKKKESVARLEALRRSGAQVATARQRDIYRHLAEMVESVRSRGGMALLSVATHGVTDAGGDFLVATDSLADRKLRTGVAVSEVFEEASRAGRGLVLLDACREQVLRARGEGAGAAAMGKGFAEAIAKARGLVVLSGATLGGFAYDDPKRRNGVFTAAVLDGLHGGAAPGPGGWITVRTLADFVQEQVVAWIRREWPREEERSRGIGRRIEASAENLPLAPHPSATRERERYRERRKKALDRVHDLQGEVLSGAHWDQVRALLPAEEPNAEAEKLLEEIEALDGGLRSQRGLRDYLRELSGERVASSPLLKPEEPRPADQAQRPARPLVSPPPAREPSGPLPEKPSVAAAERKKLRWERTWTRAALAAAGMLIVLLVAWVVVRAIYRTAPLTTEVNSLGMTFLYVPSGTYTIGSPVGVGDDDETPRHEVTLSRGFWLGETEVTQAQWTQLVPKEAPWSFKACGPDCPVESVSWYAAAMFANLLSDKEGLAPCYTLDPARCKGTLGGDYTCKDPPLPALDCPGYRLPTESEWEIAARAGQPTAEPSDLASVAWFSDNSGGSVHPVGQKQANAWGFHDLLGNVWEWTGDWKGDYPAGRVIDPQGPALGPYRVVRGGSWNALARYVRAAYRSWNHPGVRSDNLGFRLARGQGLRSGTGR